MGNACCVAARDKMVVPNSSASENLPRSNVRHSPTWSFRWDHRGRVAGEETSLSWLSDGISRNDGSEIKFESAFVSSEGSPLDNVRTQTLQKSPASDLSFLRNSSMDTVFEQNENYSTKSVAQKENYSTESVAQKENYSTESVAPSYPSPVQFSLSLASQPSPFPTSPLSSQSYLHSASSSTLKLPQRPRLSKQVSDCQIYGVNSLSRSSATEERQGTPSTYDNSQCGSSEGCSLQASSERMSSSRCNKPLPYDIDCFGLQCDKIDHHGNQMSNQQQQTCGACSRPLSEKSMWSSQKIFMTNDLSVSAILACGHVYHGECLEKMTADIDKFDPSCPICTLGEKKTTKLSERALKGARDLKARHNKRLINRVLDSDLDGDDYAMFDHSHMAAVAACKSPKLVSSSSVKSYSAKPFLARHFSFGSKGNSKSTKDKLPVKKQGVFWTKFNKM